MSIDPRILQSIPLFKSFEEVDLQRLTVLLKKRHFQDGDHIFYENDIGTSMFLISEGTVEIYKKLNDERYHIADLSAGDFFGELAILEDKPRNASVVAKSAVSSYELNKKDFFELSRENPRIALKVLEVLSLRLRKSDEKFCSELASKNEELREALKKLNMLNEMKTNFITLVSHELFTPITIILNATMFLSDLPLIKANASATEFTNMVLNQTQRLHDQIRQIIELSTAENFDLYSLPKEKVPVERFFQAITDEFLPLVTHRQLKMTCRYPIKNIYFSIHPLHLKGAVEALIINAIRFTPDGGSIALDLEERDGWIVLQIIDNGIGIAAEHLEAIFDPFFEVQAIEHHSSGQFEFMSSGLGLGLTIAKRIVTIHGGTLRVESTPGKGSMFTMELPIE